MKVLIVDDEPVAASSLREALEKTARDKHIEIEFFIAADGWEALTIIRAHRIDIIASDMNMPVMDGYELLKGVRKDQDTEVAGLPFLMYTRSADPSENLMKLAQIQLVTEFISNSTAAKVADALLDRIAQAADKNNQILRNLLNPDPQ